jgi:RNA polymerase sigma-70 factor (ECF subfamily)
MIQYESLTEKKLCGLVKNGDSKAFEHLYSKHGGRVKSFILSKCRDGLLAEEIAQITWIKVWKKIGSFKNKSKLRTWICRIAFNAFYDYKKKRKREVFLEEMSGDKESFLGAVCPEIATPYKNLEQKEEFSFHSKKLNKILSSLSKEKKEMADLVLLKGMTYEQASKQANVPVGTVMSRVYYLRKELKKNWDA